MRGIPIELFLMCFNFHFLLLENTDGDSLPLILSGAGREGGVQHTRAPLPVLENRSQHQALLLPLASVYPFVKV